MKTHTTILILIAIFLVGCDTKSVNMPSESMIPTIPKNSTVTLDVGAYRSDNPQRFDIVAFVPPHDLKALYIFRIIGLPNESIELKNNKIYINNTMVDIPHNITYFSDSGTVNKISLGKDEFYVLGDNSKNARDSRFFGPITRKSIQAKYVNSKPNK